MAADILPIQPPGPPAQPARPAPTPSKPMARTEATRYLCAGAELDEDFSDHIISELFTQMKRAVAPSFGIDLVPIANHCFRGRRRRAWRAVALLLAIVVEWVVFPVATTALVLIAALIRAVRRRRLRTLLGWGLVLFILWLLIGHPMPAGEWVKGVWGSPERIGWWLISLAILLGLAIFIRYGEWHYAHWLVRRQLRSENFDPYTLK